MIMKISGRLAAPLCALVLGFSPALAQDSTPHVPLQKTIGAVTATGPVPSLAVLNADGATLADGKLVLTGISPNSIVFADRPIRSAGHVMTAQFLQQWDEGKDSFFADPPNATVSVLGGEGSDVSDAVVVLTKPVLDGTTLTFEVTVLEGALAGSGPAAVFIDDFRGGGGGFHASGGTYTGPHGGTASFGSVSGYHGGAISNNYYHAPNYHGAWYGAAPVAGAALAGAAVGAAVAGAAGGYYPGAPYYPGSPLCGYYPYPPCY
ncbi:MAG: hypothetical protein RLZZ413_441 [Pseudomonadota bacterium]|jgi:hypothetical protein